MVAVVATAAAAAFGKFYPVIAPFIGLLGGFVSGSESSAIAMLTKLHLATAEKIGAYGILIAAASGHRRRAGQRHLAGEAAERGGEHRPHRRGGQGHPGHLRHLAGHHPGLRGADPAVELLKE